MTFPHIDDYGLTADQLSEKYERRGSHPGYPVHDWKQQVMCSNTLRGYWDWVVTQLQGEQDELDRDNPHTQHMSLEGQIVTAGSTVLERFGVNREEALAGLERYRLDFPLGARLFQVCRVPGALGLEWAVVQDSP